MQYYVAIDAPFGFGNSLIMKKDGPQWVLGPKWLSPRHFLGLDQGL